jgi:predicted peptidase
MACMPDDMPTRWQHVIQLCDPALWAFHGAVFVDADGQRLPYRLLAPTHVSRQTRYPLILFLHGHGVEGLDNRLQVLGLGPIFLNKAFRRNFPCYVLAPQCPPDASWDHAIGYAKQSEYRLLPDASRPMRQVLRLLDRLQRVYPIDPARIYVMGYSMGGSGTWDVISRQPRRFAAAVVFCGRADTSQAAKLTRLPMWVFHGALDDTIDVGWSRGMVAAMTRAGGHPRYTEFTGVGHSCWMRAMAEPELFPWLFAENRTTNGPCARGADEKCG